MRFDSLRAQLLAGLMVPLGLFALVEFSVAYRTAENTARIVTDRILLASARSIAEHVAVAETGAEAFAPPSALGMFNLGYGDSVYYQITSGGTLLAGYTDLPAAPVSAQGAEPVYFDGRYHGHALRLVRVSQPVPARGGAGEAVVIVAETLNGRNAMSRQLWLGSAAGQFLLVAFACTLAWFALHRVLAPLSQLSGEVRERKPDDLRPFAVAELQAELDPLLRALNVYMLRLAAQLAAQRRFTANAAHQLRTPLALLRTQVSYALRSEGEGERSDALRAALSTTEQLTRLTNQLLSLAKAEPDGQPLRRELLDLASVTRGILEEHGRLAVDRGVDLAFEVSTGQTPWVHADPTTLRDLIVNLVDNAVRYTPSGGHVLVAVARNGTVCSLRIEDTGPGIPAAQRVLVFERFFRLPGRDVDGSGLGLSIVKEIAEAHGAEIRLDGRGEETGLSVEVRFRAAAAASEPVMLSKVT